MKKLVKITSILGATVLGLTTAGIGVANAADVTTDENGSATTTAKVGLQDDPDAKVQLVKAPVFDFGSTKIGSEALSLQAESVDSPLQVNNPGKLAGWNVTLAGTAFKNADASKTLTGADLILNGVVSPEDNANQSVAPTTGSLTVNDAAQPIFTAAANAGIGNWLNTFEAGSPAATLNIPQGNVADTYTADLTWTLTDAPSA